MENRNDSTLKTGKATNLDDYLNRLVERAADFSNTTAADLWRYSRLREHVRPRQAVIYVAHRNGYSIRYLAERFNKDRTTIRHSFNEIPHWIKRNPTVKLLVEELEKVK